MTDFRPMCDVKTNWEDFEKMNFTTKEECVFLSSDSGTFVAENGNSIDWNKVTFANPLTYENHELAFKPQVDFSRINKGQKLILELELEPTNKKSRVIVSGFKVA